MNIVQRSKLTFEYPIQQSKMDIVRVKTGKGIFEMGGGGVRWWGGGGCQGE